MPKYPELFVMIIWSNARAYKERILEIMRHQFWVLDAFDIRWSQAKFSENMSRFYGENLPHGSDKERHVGTGPFTLIVFSDDKPDYTIRQSHRGKVRVNANVFDWKMKFREMTGGGHMIHASDTLEETRHDLALLLGASIESYYRHNVAPGSNQNPDRIMDIDLQGADGWNSIDQFFYVLNQSHEYVVLRNFDNLPNFKDGGDVDLLVRKQRPAIYVANGSAVYENPVHPVHYWVTIGGKKIDFDIRDAEDKYMWSAFSDEILRTRILDPRGFYRPTDEMLFYSILHHALIHKDHIAAKYKSKLIELAPMVHLNITEDDFPSAENWGRILDDFMMKRGYKYHQPA